MADALLEFDPVSEDAANSPLPVWDTASYMVTAFSPDAANQSVQWASSVDTEGALPASVKDENRTISMTIECLSAAALKALQAKVAKISRERGTLKYTLPTGNTVVFDLLTRESFKPEFDVTYFLHEGAYCTVTVSFTAKPYGRGPYTTLPLRTATANQPHVWTETGVAGDIPATGNLRIQNATNTKAVVYWGVRSQYYSSAAGAALFLEAENGDMYGGVLDAGPAGASGSGGNKTVKHTSVGTTGSDTYEIKGVGGVDLSHVGTYRVFARVQAPTANTGVVSVHLRWQPALGAATVETNDWAELADEAGAAVENTWLLAELGQVSIPPVTLGTQAWSAAIEARSTVGADSVYVDWVMFVPVLEGAGEVRFPVSGAGAIIGSAAQVDIGSGAVLLGSSSGAYWGATDYEGDYLRVPVAGSDARTSEFIVLLASSPTTDEIDTANNLDVTTAQITYTPRYLVVPAP